MNKMKATVVQVNKISAVKAYHRNHVGEIPQLTRMIPPPPPPPPPTAHPLVVGNPCVDLYLRRPDAEVLYEIPASRETWEYHETLMKQQLPQAWSHNPLTTLKLMCSLIDFREHFDREAFYAAAVWLHHNHPKTLACNLLPITSIGYISDALEILSRVSQCQKVDDYPSTWIRRNNNLYHRGDTRVKERLEQTEIRLLKAKTAKEKEKAQAKAEEKAKASALLMRRKKMAVAKKAAERYDRDPDYRFLHDRVSDLYAECLKHDSQQFNKHQQELMQLQQQQGEQQNHQKVEFEITDAADDLRHSIIFPMSSPTDLLYESIARKVFPPGDESESELLVRLRKEVLVPLRQALVPEHYGEAANRWGYRPVPAFEREPSATHSAVRKYMLSLKSAIAVKSKSVSELIEAGAVLPHRILNFAVNFARAAELQWQRMVDLYLKQGKLNKCLAVCAVDNARTLGPEESLALLVSQLGGEPWKGKVVSNSRDPQLHLIQGKSLRSKCKFIASLEEECEGEVDLVKVFDLILEVAVNENVKPEQMIKKVFVFKDKFKHLVSCRRSCWENSPGDYQEIQRRFEAKGYTVPHLMIWNMISYVVPPVCSEEPGVMLLSGFSDNLVKSFLDNDGELGPEQVMEAAISPQDYQTLAVFD